jgi:hypothetical protein
LGFRHGEFQYGHDPVQAGAALQAIFETTFEFPQESGDHVRVEHFS